MKSETIDYLSLSVKFILILSIINAIYNQLWHLMSADIFLLILMFAPHIIKKYEVKIPKQFEWILLAFVIFTLFLGKLKGVITPIFFGIATAMIGFMILAILYSSNQIKKNYFLIILFSFDLAITFGFVLEMIKYYLKLALGHTITQANFAFSMQTMLFVIIGAAISSLFGFVYMKGKAGFVGNFVYKIIKSNPKIFTKANSENEFLKIIEKGESEKIEFKETLRYNINTNEIDRKIEHSVLKTICAFLNSDGGTLFIGVKNNGEISGIEKDNFENTDKFLLHFSNIIKQKIGKKFIDLIKTESVKTNNKTIVVVECGKSRVPVFLKDNAEEEFFIRAGPSTTQIKGSELVDYIGKHFKKEN